MLQDVLGDRGPVAFRVGAAVLAGLGMALVMASNGLSHYAPAAGWITGSVVFLAWTWAVVWRMDATATRQHAVHYERDGTRHVSHLMVMAASLTSIAGVGYLLSATSGDKPDLAAGIVGILSVFGSWFVVHTVYMLRYARLYYNAPDPKRPGMEFDGEPPTYLDFAYVAFSIGMCYSVPDNGLSNRKLRTTVLSHGLVSYVFGTFIIAMALNLVGGL
jgi:uncharacterized membrane protein